MNDPASDDSLLKRLRASVLRVRTTSDRSFTPAPVEEANVRDAIRLLSRSRVSQILRQLRAAHGYSYEQVREKTNLSQQLIYDVEYRDRRVTLLELAALAHCYEVSVNDILGIDLEG